MEIRGNMGEMVGTNLALLFTKETKEMEASLRVTFLAILAVHLCPEMIGIEYMYK